MTTPEQALPGGATAYSWIELARAFARGGARTELCRPVFDRLLHRVDWHEAALYRVLGRGDVLETVCAQGDLDVGSLGESAALKVAAASLADGRVDHLDAERLSELDLEGTPFQLATECVVFPLQVAGELLAILVLSSSRPRRIPSVADIETELGLLSLIFVHESQIDTAAPEGSQPWGRRLLALQTLRDMIPQAVLVKDLDNRILSANRRAGEFYHLAPAQMEGEFLWEIDPLNAGAAYREDLEVVQQRRAIVGHLEEVTGVHGQAQWIRADRAPVFGDGGEIEAVVTVIEDVTDQVLAERRLRESQADAARAERRRDQYLLALAEEVREPLRQVQRRLQQLRSCFSESEAESLAVVDEVVKIQATALTNIQDLLDFSRVENGNLAVQTYDFDLEGLCAEVLESCQQYARRRGISLASRVAPPCPARVAADAGRIRQILLQLLGTALRVARGGEVFLTCSEEPHDGQTTLCFEVRAPSSTLQPQELEEYFASYRCERTESAGRDSTHELRLSLARALTELLGGRVDVEVAADRSFCCRCSIPVRSPLETTDEGLSASPRAGARVLLCEPNENMRAIHLQRLRDLRLVVDVSSTPVLASEMIEAAHESGWPYAGILVQSDDDGELRALIETVSRIGGGEVAVMRDHPLDGDLASRASWLRLPWRQDELCDRLASMCGVDQATAALGSEDLASDRSVGRYEFLVLDDHPMRSNVTAFALRRVGGRATVVGDVEAALESLLSADYDLVLVDEEFLRDGHLSFIDQVRQADGPRRRTRVAVGVHEDRAAFCEELAALGYDGCIGKPLDTDALFRILTAPGAVLR